MTSHTDNDAAVGTGPRRRFSKRRKILIGAAVAVIVASAVTALSVTGTVNASASSYEAASTARDAAQRAASSAFDAAAAEHADAQKLSTDWPSARVGDLARLAPASSLKDVRAAGAALASAVKRGSGAPAAARASKQTTWSRPATIAEYRDAERRLRQQQHQIAAATGEARQAASDLRAAAGRFDAAISSAIKTLPAQTKVLLGRNEAAPAQVRTMFSDRMSDAVKTPTPKMVTRASEARTALEVADRAARAAQAAAARSSAAAAAAAPASPGTTGGTSTSSASGSGTTPGGIPAVRGGRTPSVPAAGSGAGTGVGGSHGGAGTVPSAPAPAPCRVTVAPVKSGAPSAAGTSGSQSGMVGGCSGPVTVNPTVPANATFTVSSSGASWSVRWSVPLPTDW